jgi:hypothetical protein
MLESWSTKNQLYRIGASSLVFTFLLRAHYLAEQFPKSEAIEKRYIQNRLLDQTT